jgi:hypothetical protein
LTFEKLQEVSPRAAFFYKAVRIDGKTYRGAAAENGCVQRTVGYWIKEAERMLADTPKPPKKSSAPSVCVPVARRLDKRLTALGRCEVCHLLKPCVCLHEAAKTLVESNQSARVYPAPGGWSYRESLRWNEQARRAA